MKNFEKDRFLPPLIDGKKPELGDPERVIGKDFMKRLRDAKDGPAEAVKDKQDPP
jgi:hypothetical protein